MPAWPVDGMDVLAVEGAARRAAAAVRAGGGPHFLEFRTYRFRAHSMFDPELYRDKQRGRGMEEARSRSPTFTATLKAAGLLGDADIQRIEKEVAAEIDEAVAFAEAGTSSPSRS